MKLNISRIPSMGDRGPESNAMMNVSLQVGKNLAQTMQCLGLRSIRLSERETMGGNGLGLDETHFFEGVPDVIFKWANNCAGAVAMFMAAFGISEISLDPERDDMYQLRAMWQQLESDRSQQVRDEPQALKKVKGGEPFAGEVYI